MKSAAIVLLIISPLLIFAPFIRAKKSPREGITIILIGSIFILCVNPPFRLKPEIPIHREGERGAVTRR